MFGVFLSYLHHFHLLRVKVFVEENKGKIFLLSCFMLLPVFIFELVSSPFIWTLGLTMNYLGLGGLMMIFIYCVNIRENKWKWLIQLGCYSYSIYLWHLPILRWTITPIAKKISGSNDGVFLLMLAYFAFTIVVGICMAKLIEIPILNYRDKIFPRIKTDH